MLLRATRFATKAMDLGALVACGARCGPVLGNHVFPASTHVATCPRPVCDSKAEARKRKQQSFAMSCHIILFCIVWCGMGLYCSVVYCIVLYCIAHYIASYHIVLYYTTYIIYVICLIILYYDIIRC